MLSARAPLPDVPASITAGKPYAVVVLLQLHWFLRLRWVFMGGALAALAVERFVLPDTRRPAALLVAVLAVGASNLVWTAVSGLLRRQLEAPGGEQRQAIRSGQFFAGAQIASDLLLLTWILSLTGGVESPMVLFYLFHAAISGLVLRTWQALAVSAWGAALFAAMALGQLAGLLPWYPLLPHLEPTRLQGDADYVVLTTVTVALAIFGTMYFTDRIGRILDQREDMLIRLNAALVESRQAIQELQQRRSRFMQTAAHQLKSPLAMVQTLANLIRDGIVTDKAGILATCDKIVHRCRDGMSQVSELLALARVQEADPRRHSKARCDLAVVVTELYGRYLPVAREKGVELTWQCRTSQSMQVRVDPQDVADCVGNLVDNAVKYTPAGGHVRIVALRGQRRLPDRPDGDGRRQEFAFVVVRDTGMGIPELAASSATGAGSIFDAFRRGHAAVAAGIPGTGLGLSIVREVVEQAGGYLHAYSEPGRGSNFTVAFPVIEEGSLGGRAGEPAGMAVGGG